MRTRTLSPVIAMIAAAAALASGTASAIDNKLQDAFNAMTAPGYTDLQGARKYNGTLRSGVDFGSGRVVSGASPSNISVINITPPQVTVGCGGIDFHLGGISWLNWDQFSALLDSVLMSAQYAVVNMALDWISEKLGSTFKATMNALMNATRGEIDACKLGKDLARRVANGLENPGDIAEAMCADSKQSDGEADSYGVAGNICSDFNKMIDEKKKIFNDWKAQIGLEGMQSNDGTTVTRPTGDRDTPKPIACIGNCTWQTLRAAGFAPTLKNRSSADPAAASTDAAVNNYLAGVAFAELLMSGVGVHTGQASDVGTADPKASQPLPQAASSQGPTLPVDAMVAIFMCGTKYLTAKDTSDITSDASAAGDLSGNQDVKDGLIATSAAQIQAICEKVKALGASGSSSAQLKIVTCMPGDVATSYAKAEGDYSGANDSALSALVGLDGVGLKNAKDLCEVPIPIPIDQWASQPYVSGSFLSEGLLTRDMRIMQSIFAKLIRGDIALEKSEVDFLLSAPTPVYQMLSMAALFPTQGLQMVQSEALMVSALQTEAFVDRLVNDAAKNSDRQIPLFAEDLEKILSYLGKTSQVYGSVNIDVDRQLQRMTALQAQVKVLQTAVMDSIYGHGLMGNMTFTADIAKAAGP